MNDISAIWEVLTAILEPISGPAPNGAPINSPEGQEYLAKVRIDMKNLIDRVREIQDC